MKVVQNVGYAPNPGTRRRNQMSYQTVFSPNKKKGKSVPSSPLGRGKNLSNIDPTDSSLSIQEDPEQTDTRTDQYIANCLQRMTANRWDQLASGNLVSPQVSSALDLLLKRYQSSFSTSSPSVTTSSVSDSSLTSLDPNYFTSQIPQFLHPNSVSFDYSPVTDDLRVSTAHPASNTSLDSKSKYSVYTGIDSPARALRGQGFQPTNNTGIGRKITRSLSEPWMVNIESVVNKAEAKRPE